MSSKLHRVRNARAVNDLAHRLRQLLLGGITQVVPYHPTTLRREFDALPHIFHQVVQRLKHEFRVVRRASTYRQASKAHDYEPDTYTLYAPRETVATTYDFPNGRNGQPKRRRS